MKETFKIYRNMLIELLEIYDRIVPNDKTYLSAYPDLIEEIGRIEKYKEILCEEDVKSIEKACVHVIYFIDKWFPDSWDEKEKNELIKTIESYKRKLHKLSGN